MAAVSILPAERIQATLRRMAFELAERAYGSPTIHLMGLNVRGPFLAQRLADELQLIGTITPVLLHPTDAVPLDAPLALVDDVLYSGATLLQQLAALNNRQTMPAKVLVAVLIDRGHRRYPVSADVVGVQLVTTLQQYVRVEVEAGTIYAFLE